MQTIEAKKFRNVVACVLIKNEKILITSRPKIKTFAGFFEFPGGKVEKGEYLLEALEREMIEELGISLDFSKVFYLKKYKIHEQNIYLNFFLCLKWFGKIKNKERQKLKWIFPTELNNYNLLKSNESFISFLNDFIFPTAY
tara:strand:+ start:221 stop:643 length:423 start_codon:yes stop_codon:yes gene_type:complete